MIDAKIIAKYIISKFQSIATNEIEGDLTNLKLQKILYYIQITSVKELKKEAFANTIEAWKYGPVIPDVYHEYKHHRNNVITIDTPVFAIDKSQLELIVDKVIKDKGRYTGYALMNMTHNEHPWLSALKTDSKIITNDLLQLSL